MGDNYPGVSYVPANNDPDDVTDIRALISQANFVQDNLVRNGNMEYWSAGAAAAPTGWTLTGTGAAAARSADEKRGDYAAQVTYGSADSYIYQANADFPDFASRRLLAWAWVKTSTASIAKLTINDGVGSTSSSYHTGGGTYELLAVEHVCDASLTKLWLELHVIAAGNAIFDLATLVDFHDARGLVASRQDSLRVIEDTEAVILAMTPSGPATARATDTGQKFEYWPAAAAWEARP